jgi:hypothetical protein
MGEGWGVPFKTTRGTSNITKYGWVAHVQAAVIIRFMENGTKTR